MNDRSRGPVNRFLRRITAGKWRVAWGYAGAVLLLLMAHPVPVTILMGLPFVLLGEVVRIVANGSLVKDKRFTNWGIYAHIRHPLYTGSALTGLGFLLMAQDLVLTIIMLLIFPFLYRRAVLREESKMAGLYGEQYRQWAEAVPRFLPRRFSIGEIVEGCRLERAWANREQQGVLGVIAIVALLYLKFRLMG